MKKTISLFFASVVLFSSIATQSHAGIKIFSCEPEWSALATELGATAADVYTATHGLQDPHHIQARPSLIAKVRNADLVICTGAELEVGWLPLLLQQSGNPKIQVGQTGYFMATDFVKKLEVPKRVDRSMGDIHAEGNPHIQLDPRLIATVALAMSQRMQQIDPFQREHYANSYKQFSERWQQAIQRWNQLAAPLKGVPVVSQHNGFVYLYDWLGIQEIAVLEPQHGVDPSVSHLQKILNNLKQKPARMVIYAAYQDPRASQWLNKNAGLPAVQLPFTVGGSTSANNLYSLMDDTLAKLLKANNP